MGNKTCIKRKHVFFGLLSAYPVGYILYSWYYWFTHLYLVDHYRNEFANQHGFYEISHWNYITYPFYDIPQIYGAVFFVSFVIGVVWVLSWVCTETYHSKFMSKCVVKR